MQAANYRPSPSDGTCRRGSMVNNIVIATCGVTWELDFSRGGSLQKADECLIIRLYT